MAGNIIDLLVLIGVLALIGIAITKKRSRATPHELVARQMLIDAAVANSPNAIVVTDAANKVMLWNSGAEKLLGHKHDQAMGKDLVFIGIILSEINQRNTPVDIEVMHGMKSMIPVSLTVNDCKVQGVTHYLGIMKGIRERKDKEALLLRELKLLNTGEQMGGYGSWAWDVATNRVMVTEGFNRIFESEDQVTDVEFLMNRVYYQDKAAVKAVLDEAIKNEKPYTVSYRIMRSNGQLISVFVKGEMFFDAEGALEMIVGTLKQMDDAV